MNEAFAFTRDCDCTSLIEEAELRKPNRRGSLDQKPSNERVSVMPTEVCTLDLVGPFVLEGKEQPHDIARHRER